MLHRPVKPYIFRKPTNGQRHRQRQRQNDWKTSHVLHFRELPKDIKYDKVDAKYKNKDKDKDKTTERLKICYIFENMMKLMLHKWFTAGDAQKVTKVMQRRWCTEGDAWKVMHERWCTEDIQRRRCTYLILVIFFHNRILEKKIFPSNVRKFWQNLPHHKTA